jgi:hypothetical protein
MVLQRAPQQAVVWGYVDTLGNQRRHLVSRYVIDGTDEVSFSKSLGESNTNYNRDKYICTFSKLIESWRAIWYSRTNSNTDPTFPFGFVQVCSCLIVNLIFSILSSLAINSYE